MLHFLTIQCHYFYPSIFLTIFNFTLIIRHNIMTGVNVVLACGNHTCGIFFNDRPAFFTEWYLLLVYIYWTISLNLYQPNFGLSWSLHMFCQVFCEKDLHACNFIKKRLQDRCFPVNIKNFFKTAFIEQLLTASNESILLRLNCAFSWDESRDNFWLVPGRVQN